MEDINKKVMQNFNIGKEELCSKIAAEIKGLQLNDVMDEAAINKIIDDMIHKREMQVANESVPQLIPEVQSNQPVNPISPTDSGNPYEVNPSAPPAKSEIDIFPSTDKLTPGPINMGLTGGTNYTQQDGQNIDSGTSGDIPAYKPKLPAFMDKIAPAEIMIFNMNDLAEGGENLSHKPFRTLENPDIKKNMQDFWSTNGTQKANVYIARFEKVGEIEFDYRDGTSQFHENRVTMDNNAVNNYHKNPYTAQETPEIIDSKIDKPGLETYIKSTVDLEKILHDMIENILKSYFNTNQTKAVNDPTVIVPVEENSLNNPDGPGYGYSVAQAVKPMEENSHAFNLKMVDIVNNYTKKELPISLQESIGSGSNKYLKRKNDEVEEWLFEDISYFTPINKISTSKGYINDQAGLQPISYAKKGRITL